MQIINQSTGHMVADKGRIADSAMSRLIGLLDRASLLEKEGLVITQCRAIHMLFMRFPIDVIFIDKNNKVVGLVKHIKPFQFSPYFWRACCAIELSAGTIDASGTQLGDVVSFA